MKMKNQSNGIKSKSKPKALPQITNPDTSTKQIKQIKQKGKKKKKAIPQQIGKRAPSEEKDNKATKEKRVIKSALSSSQSDEEEEKTDEIFSKYSNSISEKATKESLKRLIDTSSDLLMKQNGIIEKCDDLEKVISANDYEMDRLLIKQERDNFPQVIGEYSGDLENILNKLRKNTAELDEAKRLREENSSLRYKLEMLSIDKNDDYLTIESKINSMRNVYASEINSMMSFFNEMGLDNPIQKINSSTFTEDKVIQFFSLCKKHFKSLKNTVVSQEEKINYLSQENLKISEEIDQTKRRADHMLRKKNMEFGESMQINTPLSGTCCPYDVEQLKSQTQSQLLSQSNLKSQYQFGSQLQSQCQSQSQMNNQDQFQAGLSQSMAKDERSFMDVYRRNKDLRYSNDDNDDLGLEHKYTDSCFYQPNEDNQTQNQNQSYNYSRKNNTNVFY